MHKLGIVRKELNESYVWLRKLEKAGIAEKDRLTDLLRECDELCRIITASKKTLNGGREGSGWAENSE